MKKILGQRLQHARQDQAGFTMLLTVLLALTIFGLLFFALLILVTMEARRSVSQKNTNDAFYEAEGLMNEQYLALEIMDPATFLSFTGGLATTGPQDCSPNPDLACELREVAGNPYAVDIFIQAKVGTATRKLEGRYYHPNASMPTAGPSPTQIVTPTPYYNPNRACVLGFYVSKSDCNQWCNGAGDCMSGSCQMNPTLPGYQTCLCVLPTPTLTTDPAFNYFETEPSPIP